MIETPIYLCGYRPEALKKAKKVFKNFIVVDFKHRKPTKSKYQYVSFEDLHSQSDKYLDANSILIPTTEKGVLIQSMLLNKIDRVQDSQFLEKFIDKSIMKYFCQKNGIPITNYVQTNTSTPEDVDQNFGYPVYIKRKISSGSRHQRMAQNFEELTSFWGNDLIVEKHIEGRELSIESFVYENQICFTNFTTYYKHHISNIVPGVFTPEEESRLLEFNKKVIDLFKVQKGLIHIECFLQSDKIIFGEIAIRPPGGHIMKLIEKCYGFEPWSEYFKLFLNQKPITRTTAQGIAAVWILHPGEGKVKDIWGLNEVLKDKNLFKYKLKIAKGDKLKKRTGSGQNYGYFLYYGKDHASIQRSLDLIDSKLEILLDK